MTAPSQPQVAVYRFYAPDGWLLYIGMTVDLDMRFAHHTQTAAWWNLADRTRTTITWYATRAEAAAAEMSAIQTEKPEWNIVGREGRRAGRPTTVLTRFQEEAVDDVAKAIEAAELAEAEAWLLVQAGREAGIPDTVLCTRTGISRATLNRKLGKRPTAAA